MNRNPIQLSLSREAELAAESFAVGATALGRANYAHQAQYLQAFFALSNAIERSAKLVIVVDGALKDPNLALPPSSVIRPYSHNLSRLIDAVEAISVARASSWPSIRPRSPIHDAIIEILTNFAQNAGRYHDIESALGAPKALSSVAPIEAWMTRVVDPIAQRHIRQRQIDRIEREARTMDALIGPYSLVRFHDEQGRGINTVYEGARHSGVNALTKPVGAHVRAAVCPLHR